MFYGLVGHRLRQNGAQVLIDLTYGNVNPVKWRNIVRGRSLEFAGPFLCTMAYDPKRKSGSAAAIAYQGGKRADSREGHNWKQWCGRICGVHPG
jgi:hypothetical protein